MDGLVSLLDARPVPPHPRCRTQALRRPVHHEGSCCGSDAGQHYAGPASFDPP